VTKADTQVLALSCEIDLMKIKLKQHQKDLFQMSNDLFGAWNVMENDFSLVFGKEWMTIRTENNNFAVGMELSRLSLLSLTKEQHNMLIRSISARVIPSNDESCCGIVSILQRISNLEQSVVLVRKRPQASGGLLAQLLVDNLEKERENKARRLSDNLNLCDDSLYDCSETSSIVDSTADEDSSGDEFEEENSVIVAGQRVTALYDSSAESDCSSLAYSTSSTHVKHTRIVLPSHRMLDVKFKTAEAASQAALLILTDRFTQRKRVSDLNLEKLKKVEEARLAEVDLTRLLFWSEGEAMSLDRSSRHKDAINTANLAFQNHIVVVQARQRAVDEAEASGELVAVLMSGESEAFAGTCDKTLENEKEIQSLVKFAESDLARLRSRHLLAEKRANDEVVSRLTKLRATSDLASVTYLSSVSEIKEADRVATLTLDELCAAEKVKFITEFKSALTKSELQIFLSVYHC
jgi:hypothetical protein